MKNQPSSSLKDLDPNSLTNQSIAANPMIFTPFSVGGRNCIGQHIAMMEGKIILGMFLKMFNYDVTDPKYKLNMDMKFLYEPKDAVMYDIETKCWLNCMRVIKNREK